MYKALNPIYPHMENLVFPHFFIYAAIHGFYTLTTAWMELEFVRTKVGESVIERFWSEEEQGDRKLL